VGVGAERAARVDDHLLQPAVRLRTDARHPQEARPHIGVGGAERHEDAGPRVSSQSQGKSDPAGRFTIEGPT
jgi:hypothetical protein